MQILSPFMRDDPAPHWKRKQKRVQRVIFEPAAPSSTLPAEMERSLDIIRDVFEWLEARRLSLLLPARRERVSNAMERLLD